MACTSGGIQVQPLCSPCTGTHTDPCYTGFTVESCNANTVPNTLLLTVPAEALSNSPPGDPGTVGCTRCVRDFAGQFVLVFDGALSFYAATPADPNACAWGYRRQSFNSPCSAGAPQFMAADYVFWFSGDGVGHVMLTTSAVLGIQGWNIHWQGTVTAGPGNCLAIDADLAWDRNEPYPYFEPFVLNRNCYGVPGVSVHVQALN